MSTNYDGNFHYSSWVFIYDPDVTNSPTENKDFPKINPGRAMGPYQKNVYMLNLIQASSNA